MKETLIAEERILAIQEAMCGFIVNEIIDKAGEFYYDGVSNIDNRSKYDNIKKNFCCTLNVIKYVYVYISKLFYFYVIKYMYIYMHIYLGVFNCIYQL